MSELRQPLFPIIRKLAKPTTVLLLKTSVTPNQVTWASILLGLMANAALLIGTRDGDVGCGLLLTASYVLDNSDGDIARAKRMSSSFGAFLDTTGDFVVHMTFFATLGVAIYLRTGADVWLWCGGLATLGNIVNYVIGRLHDDNSPSHSSEGGGGFKYPANDASLGKWLAFVLRELMRADFCFIVLGLGFIDELRLLLPLGALGAQAYWIAYFAVRKEHYHV